MVTASAASAPSTTSSMAWSSTSSLFISHLIYSLLKICVHWLCTRLCRGLSAANIQFRHSRGYGSSRGLSCVVILLRRIRRGRACLHCGGDGGRLSVRCSVPGTWTGERYDGHYAIVFGSCRSSFGGSGSLGRWRESSCDGWF